MNKVEQNGACTMCIDGVLPEKNTSKNKNGLSTCPNRFYRTYFLKRIYFNSFNNVSPANTPNLLEVKGLALLINFLTATTVLSDLVYITSTPKIFVFSLKA